MLAHLFYLLVGGLFIVLHRPSTLLRPQWVARFSAKAGIHWSELHIQSRSMGFLRPEIRISWNAVKIDLPTLHASSGPGDVALVLNFRQFPPGIAKVEEIRIARGVIEPISTPSAAETNAPSKSISLPPWISSFSQAEIGPIWVQVADWRINGDHGRALIRHFSDGTQWRWQVRANEHAHHALAELEAHSATHRLQGVWNLRLNARTGPLSPLIRRAWLKNCELTLNGSTELQLTSCPLGVSARLPHVPEIPKLRFNNRIEAILTARLSSSDLFDLNRRVQLQSALRLRPVLPAGKARGLGKIAGGLNVAGDLVPSDPAKKWNLHSAVDLQLLIGHFHRLVAFLSQTELAIPAPFASLRGHVTLRANGEVGLNHARVPILFQTRLHSPQQTFDLDAKGTLMAERVSPPLHPHLELMLILTDIQIPLPHLELAKLPQLLPDQRITKRPRLAAPRQEAGKAPPASEPTYRIVIKTGNTPIRIHTNLAKALIPVRVDITLDSGRPPLGTVHVDSFPLNLFRRDAEVRSFDLQLKPKEQRISGTIRVQYPDYTIFIHLFGTLDQPGYSFTSNPPLSDSDVISVLLFGQTSADLDAGQTQSVGNVRSAVAGRALSLASMYLLASTPIESVGFDPESGTVTMRFRLASGTSLNVTEGQESLQSIAIRHRIGKHWAITTQLGNPADPTDKSISALFQWSHRY